MVKMGLPFVSAELKGPRKLLRIRSIITDFGPKSAPEPDEAKPKMLGAVPTNQHKPNPIEGGPVSGKLSNCEIAQPSRGSLSKEVEGDTSHLLDGCHDGQARSDSPPSASAPKERQSQHEHA